MCKHWMGDIKYWKHLARQSLWPWKMYTIHATLLKHLRCSCSSCRKIMVHTILLVPWFFLFVTDGLAIHTSIISLFLITVIFCVLFTAVMFLFEVFLQLHGWLLNIVCVLMIRCLVLYRFLWICLVRNASCKWSYVLVTVLLSLHIFLMGRVGNDVAGMRRACEDCGTTCLALLGTLFLCVIKRKCEVSALVTLPDFSLECLSEKEIKSPWCILINVAACSM